LISLAREIRDLNRQAIAISSETIFQNRLASCRNEFVRKYACKHFSQGDEDGITLAILRRIGCAEPPTFVELGVGDGLENNTLVLLASGSKGCWLGGQDLAFSIPPAARLSFRKAWIDSSNLIDLFNQCCNVLSVDCPDVVSIDLDGNDFHFCDQLLAAGVKPKVFICEYNAILPPDTKWVMPYNAQHTWNSDHLFGASLASFNELFVKNGYFLCGCTPQHGTNAFFVQSEYRQQFPDVPDAIAETYMPPLYLTSTRFTHSISANFVVSLLR
jgi:hypothetical protein